MNEIQIHSDISRMLVINPNNKSARIAWEKFKWNQLPLWYIKDRSKQKEIIEKINALRGGDLYK